MEHIIKKTRERFSFAWSKFAKKEVAKEWYKDSFSYLKMVPKEIFSGAGRMGLDVGCGSGADILNIAQYGSNMVGIDISDSILVTKENVKGHKNISLVKASVYDLPFKDDSFDFAYSFGVLHHLPDPERGFTAIINKIKKGGHIIIYVYEDFAGRSRVERFLLKAVNMLRIATTRMPPVLLHALCILMSPFVFLFCSLPYQVLKRIGPAKKIAERIPFRHTMRLDCIVSDLYDRFSPPVEKRYNKEEIADWFKRSGLDDIQIRYYRGWVGWGRKR